MGYLTYVYVTDVSFTWILLMWWHDSL